MTRGRLWLIIGVVAVAAAVLMAIVVGTSRGTGSSGAPGTKAPLPAYRVVEDRGRLMDVEVNSAAEADVRRVADHLHQVSPGEDSRTVAFVCPGGPANVAYARWANTQTGLVQTGLAERDVVVVEMTGQPCVT